MNYPSIRIEGSIFSPDIIDRLEDMQGQRPADFGFESGTRVKDEIARAWADAQDYWRIFQRKLETLKPDSPATSETRNLWVVPLLGLLKYDLEYQKSGVELNGKNYAISHRVTNRAQTPIHIVGYRDAAGLDRKREDSSRRMSAHAIVQEYFNLTEQLYGLVTNGRMLRLLRDSSRLIKQSYLEFDLDRIFTDGLFADFAVLYRLLHASRLPGTVEAATESLVERYHQDSLDSGARIRDGLSKAVEDAILSFANGFLSHRENAPLREAIASGTLTPDAFYKSLLRLIYRLLFLMVIEERGLVFPPDATQKQRKAYDLYYSVQRLRRLAEKRYLADGRQHDLWLALLSTFRLFEAHGPGDKLGLKPLAGDLFRRDAIGALQQCHLANDVLLGCLRSMGLYQHPDHKQLIRVNYAALNVEEFGSVYEGLLEYAPDIDTSGHAPVFAFRKGDARAATGSHYTPDELVQPLIKHSLDYLIADKLKEKNPADALLSLRVADIACGSGHILLAAARRIATELAIVRTGEEQPSPTAYRQALRDVIRTCIYGVDLNPLAVELCKVAFWIEAHNPGEPLNFLDHHIKCGNAIVGFVTEEDVDKGVPDEAFATLPGADKKLASELRKTNKSERETREKKQVMLSFSQEFRRHREAYAKEATEIAALPETNPDEIEAKQQRYIALTNGIDAWHLRQVAHIPVAQFFISRIPENRHKFITDADFRRYWSGERQPQGEATAEAWAVGERKRCFHWFLEFPEVIERGGFDCVLGNPPFLGGGAVSSLLGKDFHNFLKQTFLAPYNVETVRGQIDLVAYFFRRAFDLLRETGSCGFIATNSVSQGDTRQAGLAVIQQQGGIINFAARSVRWPGKANVYVSLLSFSRNFRAFSQVLDGITVSEITSHLGEGSEQHAPTPLRANENLSFEGSKPYGDGFIISELEALQIIEGDEASRSVLSPYLGGSDLNQSPDQCARRWIINFFDMSEEEASRFVTPFEIIRTRVWPERQAIEPSNGWNRQMRRLWWRFGAYRPNLYEAIALLPRVLVQTRVTRTHGFAFVTSKQVLSDSLTVIALSRYADFAVLQSTLHEYWAWTHGSTMKTDRRYTPARCFQTFPFPISHNSQQFMLEYVGEQYHEHRRQLMLSLWLGLTDVYNLFHSRDLEKALKKHYDTRAKKDPQGLKIPAEHRKRALAFTYDQAFAGILELRRLHVALDTAVRDAYGWHDLPLGHDFHEVDTLPENDRTRYTISPTARRELLRLLLKENHARAAQEATSAPYAKVKKKRSSEATDELELFEEEA